MGRSHVYCGRTTRGFFEEKKEVILFLEYYSCVDGEFKHL